MTEENFHLTLTVTPAGKRRIDRLQVLSGAESLPHLLHRALAVYNELITRKRAGYDTVLSNPITGDEFIPSLTWDAKDKKMDDGT